MHSKGLFTAHGLNWPEHVDPVTRCVHWSRTSVARPTSYWLAAANWEFGSFSIHVFQCGRSHWSSQTANSSVQTGVQFSSVHVLWTSLTYLLLTCLYPQQQSSSAHAHPAHWTRGGWVCLRRVLSQCVCLLVTRVSCAKTLTDWRMPYQFGNEALLAIRS